MEHLPEPRPRFLLPKARRGDGFGYTTLPPRPVRDDSPAVRQKIAEARTPADEPEVLEKGEWNRHIKQRARDTEELRRLVETRRAEQTRRLLTFEQRLVQTQAEARRRHVDVSGEIRQLKHMQAKGKDVRHLEQRLGTMERKVYRDVDLGEAA